MAGLHAGGSAPTPRHRPFPPSRPALVSSVPLQPRQVALPVPFQPFSAPPPSPPEALAPAASWEPWNLHPTTHLFPQMPSPLPEAWCSAQASPPPSVQPWPSHPVSPRHTQPCPPPASSTHFCQPLPLHPDLSFPPARSVSRRDRMPGPWSPPATNMSAFPSFCGKHLSTPCLPFFLVLQKH